MSIFGRKKEEKEEDIKFMCKVGRMGENGMIIWVPKRFYNLFERGKYVEVIIRKLH